MMGKRAPLKYRPQGMNRISAWFGPIQVYPERLDVVEGQAMDTNPDRMGCRLYAEGPRRAKEILAALGGRNGGCGTR